MILDKKGYLLVQLEECLRPESALELQVYILPKKPHSHSLFVLSLQLILFCSTVKCEVDQCGNLYPFFPHLFHLVKRWSECRMKDWFKDVSLLLKSSFHGYSPLYTRWNLFRLKSLRCIILSYCFDCSFLTYFHNYSRLADKCMPIQTGRKGFIFEFLNERSVMNAEVTFGELILQIKCFN